MKRASQESAEALNASRQVTLAQKQDLLDLYMDKKRPLWTGQMHQLFLVTTTFLDSWRSWIRYVRVCDVSLVNKLILLVVLSLSADYNEYLPV